MKKDTQLFESEKTLVFTPPEGEFALMNYRISSEFHIPFRLVPFIDELSGNRLDISLKVFNYSRFNVFICCGYEL